MVDIDPKENIMCITFSGKKDRFFIIPIKNGKPIIKKIKSGRISILFNIPKDEVVTSPIIYAHREWLKYQDDEYPFTIEPSSRAITSFNLHHDGGKVENDSLYTLLIEFFNLDAWNDFE